MSKRGKVMSILVMCLLFFISCEKIDSFIEKNSVDTEEQMESTEGTISDISSDISNDIENEIKNNKELATDYFWQDKITDDTVAVIVNNITDEEYSSLNNVETVILGDTTEGIVAVAAIDGIDMEIWSLEYSEDELKEKEMIHKRKSMKVNEAINIETLIPEGTPSYKIKGSSSQGDFQYIIQYNGFNSGKHIEYISYGVDTTNNSSEKSKIKTMKCRLFFFDGVNMQQYYIDKEIAVEDRAVIKALTKELQKAEQYDNNFLALSDKVEITSAKVENGVLKVEFSSDYTLDETLGSSNEDGLLNSLINTYGYNLGVDKVAIYFGNELYTGVKGELEPGYFKVDFSSAEIYS